MTSRTTAEFWARYQQLPLDVQTLAVEKYRLWEQNPYHPSLHFKPLRREVWSVRVNLQYRALALRRGEEFVWFWIGPHSEYDRLVRGGT